MNASVAIVVLSLRMREVFHFWPSRAFLIAFEIVHSNVALSENLNFKRLEQLHSAYLDNHYND